MSLFDDLQENISDLKDNLKIASAKISKNSKEIKKQAKIKLELAKEERKLNDLYKDIGKEYYKMHKRLGDSENTPISNYLREVDISIAKIEALKTKTDNFSSYYNESDDYYEEHPNKISDYKENKEDTVYIDDSELK